MALERQHMVVYSHEIRVGYQANLQIIKKFPCYQKEITTVVVILYIICLAFNTLSSYLLYKFTGYMYFTSIASIAVRVLSILIYVVHIYNKVIPHF